MKNAVNILDLSIVNAQIFNIHNMQEYHQNPMLRIYIYIDDVFQYKTEIFDQSNNPILDLNLRFELLEGS